MIEGVDLHVHSHRSDGADAPDQLIRQASGALRILSICDHDTIAAYDDLAGDSAGCVDAGVAALAGASVNATSAALTLLPGIEVTCRYGATTIHMLGYFPDGFTPRFRDYVRDFEDDRRQRVHTGVESLRRRGIGLRWSLLEEVVGPGIPCRSHVARALQRMGYGQSPHGLYQRYLRSAGFPLVKLETADAITMITEEGGVPVWAHPQLDHVAEFGRELVRQGLRGVELWGRHGRGSRRQALRDFQDQHRLIATGGSDYHASGKRFYLGRFRMPLAEVPDELRVDQRAP